MTTGRPAIVPDASREGGGAGVIALALVLALMTVVTVELAILFAGAVISSVAGWQRGSGMAVGLAVGSVVAWGLGGAVAYETARRRAATTAAALLPAALVVVLVGVAVVIRRETVASDALGGFLSALLFGLAAYAGGRLRELRIRRRDELQ